MAYTNKEKRRHPRHTSATCVWLRFPQEQFARGMVSVDLSLGGAQFRSLKPVRAGERVLVYLQLRPGAYPVECKGRVCWCEETPDGLYSFGIRFLDLLEDETVRLRRFFEGSRSGFPVLAAV